MRYECIERFRDIASHGSRKQNQQKEVNNNING